MTFEQEGSDLSLAFRIVRLSEQQTIQINKQTNKQQVRFLVRTDDKVKHDTNDKVKHDKETTIWIPDATRKLFPSHELLYDDAPWLDTRLDKTKIPLVHPLLLRHVSNLLTCKVLHIKSLSQSLKERLVPGFKLSRTTNLDEISRWNKTLRSNHFRSGLRRILLHENQELSSEIMSKLCSLGTLRIVSVSRLDTIFTLNGQDVTNKNNTSASYLVNQDTILISTTNVSPQRALMSVSMALNEIFCGAIKNLQPIEKMLDMKDPKNISSLLSFLRVTNLQGVEDAFLGTKISDTMIQRLRSFQKGEPNQDIVFKNSSSGDFCLGRIVSFKDSNVLVEIAPNTTSTFSSQDLYVVATREETRREDVMKEEKQKEKNDEEEDKKKEEDEVVIVNFKPSSESNNVSSPRILYTPPQKDWFEDEKKVMKSLEEENIKRERTLEPALPGVNTLLRKAVKIDSDVASVSVSSTTRPGHDLLRYGNFKSVGFFLARGSNLSQPLKTCLLQTIDVLRDVCEVFSYNYKYITLFYQVNAISRFNKQKILINIEPIDEHRKQNRLKDVRKHPFAYMYIYGLLIHKLAHFHDAVHGTRHAFFMEELRIEFIEAWIDMLTQKGFDPTQLEASGKYEKQLWGTQF